MFVVGQALIEVQMQAEFAISSSDQQTQAHVGTTKPMAPDLSLWFN